MKTTLDIPETLLLETMRASGSSTKREAVLRALEEYNRRSKLRALAGRLGGSKTFMSFEALAKIRKRELPGSEGAAS